MEAPCCGRWFYECDLPDGMAWCPTCVAASKACQVMCGDVAEKQPDNNPNEPPSAPEYPWRRKREAGAEITPPPKRAAATWRGIVEQCSNDGSCFLAAFPDLQEKALIYQQDMMGVPSAGQSIEASVVFLCKHIYHAWNVI